MGKIVIINGPNLNFLGQREIDKYGTTTYKELISELENYTNNQDKLIFYQSNHEGDICEFIQNIFNNEAIDGLIINPGGYTHTSVAIRDSLLLLNLPIVEVHMTDIRKRENFRKTNLIHDVCEESFVGLGIDSYKKGIDYINEK